MHKRSWTTTARASLTMPSSATAGLLVLAPKMGDGPNKLPNGAQSIQSPVFGCLWSGRMIRMWTRYYGSCGNRMEDKFGADLFAIETGDRVSGEPRSKRWTNSTVFSRQRKAEGQGRYDPNYTPKQLISPALFLLSRC